MLDGRYKVVEPIGEGAMGSVYRGERLKLGRAVAIKVINEEIPNEASRKRFEREALAMAKLEHPHCASVLDVGVHVGRPYVVMELVTGKNLKEVIKEGPVPMMRAIDLTRQVLSGLSHAHEHGVIHRDIKPANVVLSQKSGLGDHVKILDFGLARFSSQETSNLTTGVVLGTPNYMAPEQIRGSSFDHRIDLYACGVMLFELLTGSKPFEANDPVAVCFQHLNDPPPRLADKSGGRQFGPLEDVVARALAKDPADRFQTADEFAAALSDAVSKPLFSSAPPEPAVEAKPRATGRRAAATPSARKSSSSVPTSRPKSVRSLIIAGIVVGAVGIVAVVVIATTGKESKPVEPTASSPPPAATPPDAQVVSAPDPVDELVARARQMTAAGRRQQAIDLLIKARKTYPKEARLPLAAAKLYLEKVWWNDGLEQARAALALDPTLKNDAELIRLVLRGFNMTKHYDSTLARFLREDIGAPAKPFLEETAKKHANPIVRNRAADELRRYR